jgi:hypothetical protein
MAQAKINFENPEMIPKRALQISAAVDVLLRRLFEHRAKANGPITGLGVWW